MTAVPNISPTAGLFAELNRYGLQGTQYLTAGNVFFVDNGAAEASDANDGEHGYSWEMPWATLDFAIGTSH